MKKLTVLPHLERVRQILLEMAARPDCADITGYSDFGIKYHVEKGLDRAIKRYKSEAKRVSKYYKRS